MSAVIILPNLAILGHKISKNFPNGIIDQQPGLFAIGPYSVVQRSMTLPNGLVEGSTTEWPNLTASPAEEPSPGMTTDVLFDFCSFGWVGREKSGLRMTDGLTIGDFVGVSRFLEA